MTVHGLTIKVENLGCMFVFADRAVTEIIQMNAWQRGRKAEKFSKRCAILKLSA